MDRDLLLTDLKKVFKKHKAWPSGSLKLRELNGEWDEKTAECIITDEHGVFPYKDTSGPFIDFTIIPVEKVSNFTGRKVNTTIMDKDKLLANGIISPLDGKTAFSNRRDWGEHLKANGCVEYGNDLNNHKAPTEIRGDFDCRKELSQATHQVMEKYGN